MEIEKFQTHIRELAFLSESSFPMISCYLDLTAKEPSWKQVLEKRIEEINAGLIDEEIYHATQVLWNTIKDYATSALSEKAKSAAIFARGGEQTYLKFLKLQVPVETSISIDSMPYIYPLAEIKDTYHRFVVLLSSLESAHIFEIHLGAITQELWREKPELRSRMGREWTKLHYQSHRQERGKKFIKEKIALLERLMSEKGYNYLILAGDARRTAEIQRALPKALNEKVCDVVNLSAKAGHDDIVAATLKAFLAMEEMGSQLLADRLVAQFYKGDMAVLGVAESLQALYNHQADTLVIVKDCDLGIVQYCTSCGWATITHQICPNCDAESLQDRPGREELVRQAELSKCEVEVVESSPMLAGLGGVGCLLRFGKRFA